MPLGTFLNGGTVSQLRGLPWLALSETGQVGAGSATDDAGGGSFKVWIYGAAVPCRIDPLSGAESVAANRLSDRSTHLITTPANTSVTSSNRFLIAGRGTFEVTAVQQQTAEWVQEFEVVQVT